MDLSQLMWKGFLSQRCTEKAQASLHSLARAFAVPTQYMELEEASDEDPLLCPYWEARHVCLKDHNCTTLWFLFL